MHAPETHLPGHVRNELVKARVVRLKHEGIEMRQKAQQKIDESQETGDMVAGNAYVCIAGCEVHHVHPAVGVLELGVYSCGRGQQNKRAECSRVPVVYRHSMRVLG